MLDGYWDTTFTVKDKTLYNSLNHSVFQCLHMFYMFPNSHLSSNPIPSVECTFSPFSTQVLLVFGALIKPPAQEGMHVCVHVTL